MSDAFDIILPSKAQIYFREVKSSKVFFRNNHKVHRKSDLLWSYRVEKARVLCLGVSEVNSSL